MMAWINFADLLFASLLFLFFYVRCAMPAGQEKIIGPKAYRLCFYDRLVSGGFEAVIMVNYILYYFYRLPTPLSDTFPWSWWMSLVIALTIGIPATALMVAGLRDAGEEARHTPCTASAPALSGRESRNKRWSDPMPAMENFDIKSMTPRSFSQPEQQP
jgi:hypothetical protein